VALPELALRAAAGLLLAAAARGPVALVFGNERTGLTNEELQRCHAAVHIPADPAFSSLNLAAAVQVLAYELRVAALARGAAAIDAAPAAEPAEPVDPPASLGELEGFYEHLERTLAEIDFHKGRAPENIMRRLRRLYFRALPTRREVLVLRGILSETQRAARPGAGPADRRA
jgi:tRNA (cytidine32/uridine32-2'-O)-methyltransferase